MSAPRSLLDALVTLSRLDRLPRTGWIQHGISTPESIAGHTLGMAHLALATLPALEPSLDSGRVLALILAHDAPEAESGDLPRGATKHLPRGAKRAMEQAIARELFAPMEGDWLAWIEEYAAGRTRAARFAHACDGIQLGVQSIAYLRAGQRDLDDFKRGVEELNCSEFPPLERMRESLLAAFSELG